MALTHQDVLKKLRAAVERAGSQRAVAQAVGISDAYLSDILNGKRTPGPTVLEYLGLERVYRRKS